MWLCRCIRTCKANYNNYRCRNDDTTKQADERDKGVTFKNCAPFTKCISRINNTGIDTARDIDIVMPIDNLIEYSDNYSKASGSSWQYYKDEPKGNIAGSESFKFKLEKLLLIEIQEMLKQLCH